jgi:hypothetical protein
MNKRQTTHAMKIGDICSECGEAAVVNEEGCPSNVRLSAMRAALVSADLHKWNS